MKRFDNNITTALLGVILGVLITMVSYKALEPKRKFDGDYNRWRKLNLILQEVERNYVDTINMKDMTDAAVAAALAELPAVKSAQSGFPLPGPEYRCPVKGP